MSCVHEFGIIEHFDKTKDYGYYHPEEYHCVLIHDDAMQGWGEKMMEMKSYFHCFSRPGTGLAWCGVTLIPPESLDLFYDIVYHHTDTVYTDQVPSLLAMILKAKEKNQFLIHFGV